jgi:preprotein translocase subunit YajC
MQGAESLIFLGLLIAIFYFMLIRPQKRRVRAHKRLVDSVEIGDEVVTIGGAHGTVRAIGDEDIRLEVAPGTEIRYIKSAIARRVSEDLEEEAVVLDDEPGSSTDTPTKPNREEDRA